MIDEQKQLFPFCIVWTMLPCISWFFPFIGHTGICSSQGIVFDFLGQYINKRNMAFGRPIKYVVLEPDSAVEYDHALSETNNWYVQQRHNLCSNNCHHHVADVLNRIAYQSRSDWTQLSIWWMCLTQSSYVSKLAILKTYLPFLLILLVIAFCYFTFQASLMYIRKQQQRTL